MLIIRKFRCCGNSFKTKLHHPNEVQYLCKLMIVNGFACACKQKLKTCEKNAQVANTTHITLFSPFDKSDFACVDKTKKPP